MPRRPVLTVIEREELLALPVDALERVQHYTLSDSDLAIIRQRRGEENRLGFAVQVCYLRFPGRALGVDEIPEAVLMELLVKQLGIRTECWDEYAKRPQSRVEHVAELQTRLGLRTFALSDYRRWALTLAELAQRTDRGAALAEALIESRNTTATPPASRTTSSHSPTSSATGSPRASAAWPINASTFPESPIAIRP